jgi:hypothetical protein
MRLASAAPSSTPRLKKITKNNRNGRVFVQTLMEMFQTDPNQVLVRRKINQLTGAHPYFNFLRDWGAVYSQPDQEPNTFFRFSSDFADKINAILE